MDNLEKELLGLIKKYWYSWGGLVFLIAFELLIILPYLWGLFDDTKVINRNEWYVVLFLLVTSFVVWFRTTKIYPKNKKGRIGILIAIKTENKRAFEIVRNDFISKLQKEIQLMEQREIFYVFSLNENMSKKIQNSTDSTDVLRKTRAHFIIFGECKKRLNGGNDSYFLDLNARVLHRQIPSNLKRKFSEEITEVFMQKIIFNSEEEIKGFEVTNRLTKISVKYIIAVAAYISWDFYLSLNILSDIKKQLKSEDLKFENLKKIKNRINSYMAQNHRSLMMIEYFKYRKTKDRKIWNEIKKHLNFFENHYPDDYQACLMRGIYYFLIDRNVKKARKEILKGRNRVDLTWKYSEAFLYAYEGHMDKAEKIYNSLFGSFMEPNQTFQTEDFICDILDEEPDKCQLWYCLGIINLEAKNDKESAKIYLEKFLKCSDSNVFQKQIIKAKELLESIK